MTIQQALHFGQARLEEIEEAQSILYSLLSYTLCLPVEQLWAKPDKVITQAQFSNFTDLVERAKNHEPLAYLLQKKEFYGLDFKVTQDTLIPRPETEFIVDTSLSHLKNRLAQSQPDAEFSPVLVDVGTGSGCIAITLAKYLPHARVLAIDISTAALEVAKHNAERHHISNVTFLHGSLLEPLEGVVAYRSCDAIVANLPYISDQEYEDLPLNVKNYEPSLALKSGPDADVLNRELIQQSRQWLKSNGLLLYETTNGKIVEVDASQAI